MPLSPDTQAVLLLCSALGARRGDGAAPLTPGEYNALAEALHAQGLRPADLLDLDALRRIAGRLPPAVSEERLAELLARGVALGLAVEGWTSKGLWVISRSDAAWPSRWRERLRRLAPPLLYGAGDPALLEGGGLAVAGGRHADEAALAFTAEVGAACAGAGVAVVSGGARGVDETAMGAALDAGGRAVGVVAERLTRAASAKRYRQALRDGTLALVSPFEPEARFLVGNAMARNKLVYALADRALVVAAKEGEGGTWAGATENLRRGWVPLFVWAAPEAPEGNAALLARGAHPVREAAEAVTGTVGEPAGVAHPVVHEAAPALVGGDGAPAAEEEPGDLFAVVWPHVSEALREPASAKACAERLGVLPKQMQAWLDRAVALGLARKQTKPVRYVAARAARASEASPAQLSLL